MTDMRATERLLEVISERSDDREITTAVTQLLRRGDTLVRARDLDLIVQAAAREHMLLEEDEFEALSRLSASLGGSLERTTTRRLTGIDRDDQPAAFDGP